MKPTTKPAVLVCDKCNTVTTEKLTPGRVVGGQHVAANGNGRGFTCGTWRPYEELFTQVLR